jgi:uncharacterized membrane protein
MLKDLLLVLASFFACSVEMVEATTIVLAVGVTAGWRSALRGVVAGSAALALVVIVLGSSLQTLVPIDVLRIVVGTLLLIFGMQWVRKAVQRSVGARALHDEERIFKTEVAELEAVGRQKLDWQGFVVSFKGVFLEGLEVVFIVISFGANSGHFGLTLAGAVAAVVVCTTVAVFVHRPLSRVPENSIKFVVGVMLVSFGTFWGGEGIGVGWKLGDGMLVVAIAMYAAVAFLLVEWLKRRRPQATLQPSAEVV